jgi:hypothetical protein
MRTASIIRAMNLMMEAVRTSEMSVYFNENTRRYIPEGYNLLYPFSFISPYSYLTFLFIVSTSYTLSSFVYTHISELQSLSGNVTCSYGS